MNINNNYQTNFVFDNTDMMTTICGTNNENITVLESLLGNPVFLSGNSLKYMTDKLSNREDFKKLCNSLKIAFTRNILIDSEYIKSIFLQLTGTSEVSSNETTRKNITKNINRRKKIGEEENKSYKELTDAFEESVITIPITDKKVVARTKGQLDIIQSLQKNLISFLVGPAGTGKTYIATAFALNQLLLKKKKRYIITRPVVEAGERLGFLPGDLEQKILPYLRPIYDVLYELAGEAIIKHLQENAQIEIAPLAYMRGRTLKDAIVLLDEAQNCSPAQMRMFLTRLGEGSVGIVNGDLSQSDLPIQNGLEDAISIFSHTEHINIVTLSKHDIQRSKIARIVIEGYEHAFSQKNKKNN